MLIELLQNVTTASIFGSRFLCSSLGAVMMFPWTRKSVVYKLAQRERVGPVDQREAAAAKGQSDTSSPTRSSGPPGHLHWVRPQLPKRVWPGSQYGGRARLQAVSMEPEGQILSPSQVGRNDRPAESGNVACFIDLRV